jgi:hypothetical protein
LINFSKLWPTDKLGCELWWSTKAACVASLC